jgi:hypothetical protein
MDYHFILVLVFMLIIHLINTLSYSVRIVGVRTGRIAASFALFNILVLAARISHAFQAPLLAKKIEGDILTGRTQGAEMEFRLLLAAASVGSLLGAILSPTFRNIFTGFVERFNIERSVPKLLFHSFSKAGLKQMRDSIRAPSRSNIDYFKGPGAIPVKLAIMNTVAVSVLTVGVLASLHAAYLNPDLRATASNLAPIITGIATILLLVFIDPKLSALTDDVVEGTKPEDYFFTCVIVMVITHFLGTLLAQLLLVPATRAIAYLAGVL